MRKKVVLWIQYYSTKKGNGINYYTDMEPKDMVGWIYPPLFPHLDTPLREMANRGK